MFIQMSDYFPVESLKVQAVAARNYALSRIGYEAAKGYDFDDTISYQVYKGYNPSYTSSLEDYGKKINATQAIAWTIQTDVAEGGIEKIVRQGDCVFIKKNENATNCIVRHLTEKEYLKLLTAES